ncbi:hypothetical protein AX16_006284 [Volvariella volvacea WC 439]|nr:hypothetical protein AX16_006284 [Volvariella volvacea WC 439]
MNNMEHYTVNGMPCAIDYDVFHASTGFQPTDFRPGDMNSSPSTSPTGASHLYAPYPRRKRSPTESLPLDAPTQPRTYMTPSITSRKTVPTSFIRGRPSKMPSMDDDEEDELTEEPPAANATDQEKIEWKRRQNTLAARRSRQRKLVYQQTLEQAVKDLTSERDIWRTRALMLKGLLESHGINFPDFKEE